MNAVMKEYVAKGVFLGLWAYVALLLPSWPEFGRVVVWAAGGLAVGLVAGAVFHVTRGFRPSANPVGFALLVLLDSAYFIYPGLILGLTAGAFLERPPLPPDEVAAALQAAAGAAASPAVNPVRDWLGYFAFGGAILGYGFYQLTLVRDRMWRFGIGVLVGAAVVYLAVTYLAELSTLATVPAQEAFAWYMLIGLPFFYVLTFCGETDESEVEIAALCAAAGVGLYLLRRLSNLPPTADKLIFMIPLLAYFLYVTRYQPNLRAFKHTLRGYAYLSSGQVRQALVGFSRALELNRGYKLAADGLWQLVRKVDVTTLDAETAKLLPFDYCLAMASRALVGDRAPTAAEREEAGRMLDVVERQRPDLSARTDYLRAVAHTHAKQFDAAAEVLTRLLSPETPYDAATRQAVLFPAWHLALRLHPEVVKRLGAAELAKPGRRIEAIGAIERQLAKQPDDAVAAEMKQELYAGLAEAEFLAAAANEPPTDFNYEYVEQLGLALVGNADPAQVDRGMAYLRVAGRGLPARGPVIFKTLADLAEKRGDAEAVRGYLEQVKRAGMLAGPKHLPADQKAVFLEAVRKLADDAEARGDFQAAVDDMRLFVESGKEDPNTLRRLAELYVRNGDPLNALLITERGLLYAKGDRDLLDKKRSYYFSVDVERVRAVRDKVAGWFDVAHCLKEAAAVANSKEADADTLDYGLHMARLARVMKPDSHAAMVAEARLRLRKGERDAALQLLEDVREAKRGSGEEEDAWYVATKLLGDLYLDELGRPDLAIACFNDYREYQRSGADTLYRLGQAYEAAGNPSAAVKMYETVTAYQSHPRYWDATEAVRRLKGEV